MKEERLIEEPRSLKEFLVGKEELEWYHKPQYLLAALAWVNLIALLWVFILGVELDLRRAVAGFCILLVIALVASYSEKKDD